MKQCMNIRICGHEEVTMNSIQNNDKRIKELKEKIQDQLNNLPKVTMDFNTNLVLDFHGKQYNLNMASMNTLQEVLINLYLYQTAIDALNIHEFSLNGFIVEDWIQDINKLIDIRNTKNRRKELTDAITKLDSLLSDVAKTADFLDDVENLLNG